MIIKDLLERENRRIFCIHPDEPLLKSIRVMNDKHFSALVVLSEDGQILGIITERDILRSAYQFNGRMEGLKVGDVMTKRADMVVCTVDHHMYEISEMMDRFHIRHMPIVNNMEDQELAGIVTMSDAVRCQLNLAKEKLAAVQAPVES